VCEVPNLSPHRVWSCRPPHPDQVPALPLALSRNESVWVRPVGSPERAEPCGTRGSFSTGTAGRCSTKSPATAQHEPGAHDQGLVVTPGPATAAWLTGDKHSRAGIPGAVDRGHPPRTRTAN